MDEDLVSISDVLKVSLESITKGDFAQAVATWHEEKLLNT